MEKTTDRRCNTGRVTFREEIFKVVMAITHRAVSTLFSLLAAHAGEHGSQTPPGQVL